MEEQQEILDLVLRGASPAAACLRLNVSFDRLYRTLEADPEFRRRWDELLEMLSQNVAAALYQTALKGNVTAQTFFLRSLPPRDWTAVSSAASPDDDLSQLSDEELERRIRALEPSGTDASGSGTGPSTDVPEPGRVSPSGANPDGGSAPVE